MTRPSIDLPKVERLHAVGLQPDDVIIATIQRDATPEQVDLVAAALKDEFTPHQVIVLAGIDLTVQRPAPPEPRKPPRPSRPDPGLSERDPNHRSWWARLAGGRR